MMAVRDFIDALDLNELPPELQQHKELINEIIVPSILNRQALAGRDILVGGDIEIVMEFQAAHAKSESNPDGMPLFQPFDRRCQPSASPKDTIVIMAMRDNRQIGCVAARKKWVGRPLDEEMRTLNFFYEDRLSQATPGEVCIVAKGVGAEIRSMEVALGGAGFVEPTERGTGLYSDMVKLLFLMELASWRFTHQVALLSNDNMSTIALHPSGLRHFSAPVIRLLPGQEMRKRLYWLATRHREEAIDDMMRPEVAEPGTAMNWPTARDISNAHKAAWGWAP